METVHIVEFVGVQKTYDGRTVVIENLNLSVRQGEFLTLLGGSGSGKTTTLMMLAGFETPTRGHILVKGKPIEHLPPHRRGIGVVFQNYALFPNMTVAQNLAYPLRMRKMSKREIQVKVDKAIEMVRLEGMQNRRPSELSGGQQQRVALARALVFEPNLVLMDEPLGALDKALREHMQLELKAIHKQLGITFVYVTHDQDEAMTLSDRVAVFNEGKIAQIDAPHLLYTQPSTRFVANFLGETNLLEGTVIARTASHAKVRLEEDGSVHEACCADASLVPGDRAALAIRPENLRLAAPGEPALSVQVIDSIFHGAHSRLRLRMVGGAQLSMSCNPVNLGRAAPQPGESLALAVPTEQAMVLR